MGDPYRSLPSIDWSPAPQTAVAWMTSHHRARIGVCDAEINPEDGRRLGRPYVRWRVTRDNHVTLSGTAMTVEAAKAACERAAEMLSESSWPSAFVPGGFIA